MKQLYEAGLVQLGETFLPGIGVLVEGDQITEVDNCERLSAKHRDATLIDWRGFALLPGTVNCHNHSFQSLLRGIASDEPFLKWRDEALYRYSRYLDAQTVYAGAVFAFSEMVLNGITTVTDFFYVHDRGVENDEAVIQAARDVGIRLVMARTMYDWPGAPKCYLESVQEAVARTRQLAVKYQGNPMITVHPAPHSPHAASPEMIQAGHRLAKELGTPFHLHVAEEPFEVSGILEDYGVRPVQYLHNLRVLDESLIAIHLVWLEPDEVGLLGKCNVSLAYCPSSNMYLADGITRVPELAAAGVRICLGTDGGCSNNRLSIFEEMRMTALLQKVQTLNASAVRARDVYAMGTRTCGEVLRLPIGQVARGYKADFVAVDLNDLSLHPHSLELLLSHVVYSMQPTAIRRVVVGGRTVAQDAKLQAVPNQRVRALVNTAWQRLMGNV